MNEQAHEKVQTMFNLYKNDLIRIAGESKKLRFNCIEYVCSFPSIDPYIMGAELTKTNYTIIYDDSSISLKENNKKQRKVNELIQ